MTLFSPWPSPLPVSQHQLCLRVRWSPSRSLPPAWTRGSMSDWASYCNHWPIPQPPFAPWPVLPSPERRALFLQSRVQKVVMILVHSGSGPWAPSSSQRHSTFLSHHSTVLKTTHFLCRNSSYVSHEMKKCSFREQRGLLCTVTDRLVGCTVHSLP